MTNFIPIFPLELVVFPGEELNLHIFEPRYKQLVDECFAAKKYFGIPVVIKKSIGDLGTMVEILEITKKYENGEMDIKTRGMKIFRILEILKEVPGKMYNGAIVNYPQNRLSGSKVLMKKVTESILQLHKLLNVKKDFRKTEAELNSYDLAHHAGLNLEEEYEFLGLFLELHRQEFLKRHLSKVLQVVTEMETLKKKIILNGHFKNLEGFNI